MDRTPSFSKEHYREDTIVVVIIIRSSVFFCFVLDLLWVAPELVQIPNRPPRGTQKGDVYSFAIVLQEFHTREGPYSANFMEPKGWLIQTLSLTILPFLRQPPSRFSYSHPTNEQLCKDSADVKVLKGGGEHVGLL